ncbi:MULTISPECIES: rod shape-determining protein MreC [Leuconostoc]|jgi:rod shape-determining protein MreC|uniref:Cell shape-determining protein MreC n=2 Tax=Leuconostoc citreum TaxID=33964 RepID=B1MZZ7_LEUCK|nr:MULTISPECIES: rod shape-determining protein MreC [Leuconostoc]ACA83099.1 Rod shape-determining protein MreC [Leuconostoc citreum KM20]MBU7449806.1 rod shape-determining protein MreC [Leuconostoc citreum]MCK8604640.1 rod shape-determining protein MreC [Leuconostoc citreum]MCP1276084.1 rod shape-determining protein MreC [Leuconostoc citreum]MCS8583129.1 rod shape-determining protein MreC [Leuconostoc citreum]
MRKIFSSRTVVTMIIAFIVIIGLITGSNWLAKRTNTPPFIQRFGNDLAGGVSRIIAVPTTAIGRTANSIGNLLDTFEENRTLKSKLDQFAQDKVRLQTVEEENRSLKKQLGLQATLTDYKTVSAVTISRSPTTWQSQLVINKGTNTGLKKGMPVLSGAGIIGRISEVNTTNAKVALISDTSEDANRFAITIKGGSGDVNGIVTGFNREKNQLIMGQVTSDSTIKSGDLVETSGLGGVIPAGLYVGKVARVTKDDYGLSKRIYIEPAADLGNITTVMVAVSQLGAK